MYSSIGYLGVDGQGVDRMGHQVVDEIIHKAMAGQRAQTLEARRYDFHPIMAGAVSATCVANMQMGFVDDFQFDGLER